MLRWSARPLLDVCTEDFILTYFHLYSPPSKIRQHNVSRAFVASKILQSFRGGLRQISPYASMHNFSPIYALQSKRDSAARCGRQFLHASFFEMPFKPMYQISSCGLGTQKFCSHREWLKRERLIVSSMYLLLRSPGSRT